MTVPLLRREKRKGTGNPFLNRKQNMCLYSCTRTERSMNRTIGEPIISYSKTNKHTNRRKYHFKFQNTNKIESSKVQICLLIRFRIIPSSIQGQTQSNLKNWIMPIYCLLSQILWKFRTNKIKECYVRMYFLGVLIQSIH